MSDSLKRNVVDVLTGNFDSQIPSKIVNEIFSNISQDQVHQMCEPLCHSYRCRHVWSAGEQSFIYRCRTCQTGPNSCICVECFQNGDHKGHDYSLQKSGIGGACDCGSELSWKVSGNCKHHGKHMTQNVDEITPEPFKSSFDENMEIVLRLLVETLQSIFVKVHNKEVVSQVLQYGVLTVLKIIRKCTEIDLFEFRFINLMERMKGRYNCRLLTETPSDFGVDEFLLDVCLIDCELFADELSLLILGFLSDDKTVERLYEMFIDNFICVVNSGDVCQVTIDNLNKLACQFTSNTPFNKQFFFGKVERVMSYLRVIQTFFSEKINKGQLSKSEIDVMNVFTNELFTIVNSAPEKFFENEMVLNNYIHCLNSLNFFNKEYRQMSEHVQFENHLDYTPFQVKETFLNVGILSLQNSSPDVVKKAICYGLKEYLEEYHKTIVKEPVVGVNQPISMYYPSLTFAMFGISLVKDPLEFYRTLPYQTDILTYPLMFQQFLAESELALWRKNGDSVELKKLCRLTSCGYQLEADTFLFQLAASDPLQLLDVMMFVNKVPLFDKYMSENTEKGKLEEVNECVAGAISFLQTVYNVFSDPIFSSKLNYHDHTVYNFIHLLAAQHTVASELFSGTPHGDAKDVQLDAVIEEVSEVQKRLSLKPELWKFVNPFFPYINSVDREKIQTEHALKMKNKLPEVYMYEKRSPQMKQNLLNLLHSITLTKLMCKFLDWCNNPDVIADIELLLRLRISYCEGITYNETHKQLLFEIGRRLAGNTQVGEVTANLSKNTALDDLLKGFLTVRKPNVSKDKEILKLAKESALKKMRNKLKKFDESHVCKEVGQTETPDADTSEICCICSSKDNLGFQAHIEVCDAIRACQFIETHENVLGDNTTSLWKKPYGFENGTWEWSPHRNPLWNESRDDQEFRIITACPQKIHLQCYNEHYERSGNEENIYLSKIVGCPMCKALSNIFVEQFQRQPIQLEQIGEKSVVFDIFEEVKKIAAALEPPKELDKSKSVNISITRTLTSCVKYDLQNPLSCAFLAITSIIASTLMSIEIQMRSGYSCRVLDHMDLLYSYYRIAEIVSQSLTIQYRQEVLKQLLIFSAAKNPLLQILRGFLLDKSKWTVFVTIGCMHHLLAVYSEIHKHTHLTVPIETYLPREEMFKEYENQSVNELVQKLSQTFMKQLDLLTRMIDGNFIQSKTEHPFPTTLITQLCVTNGCRGVGDFIQPTIPQKYSFIHLPQTYEQLINESQNGRCAVCGISGSKIIYNCAICMTCGCFLCYKDGKRRDDNVHSDKPIFDHMEKCSGSVGIYLLVHSATMVIITPRIHSFVKGIYIDRFGESPDSSYVFKESYNLNRELIEKIEKFYMNGEISSSPELDFYVPKLH
ncbi:ubiquitin ligase E3 alpha, putative [Entamoeba invadens IP1]|uniref:E3 ubiquitin-protein ligase n=1 Tax=Entamoeba invadens IP1 TaxID=370355 RepID=A0A0A1TW13_ENTIV|nr:ubiquitin ligase E3 alpha, putative [Entamoeba invadens IP1]ELP84714.1 ubiquitin ligase E3 alpha, putative [Entamoeba invadens IP1]|eukprot:XP_004184060.1 ubiquitin ligase E3 alpha, putative [Entamoeba invadens IP1]